MMDWNTDMDAAPKDRPFIALLNKSGATKTAWWMEQFDAFVAGCRVMMLAAGYTFKDGSYEQYHSPDIVHPIAWMELPDTSALTARKGGDDA